MKESRLDFECPGRPWGIGDAARPTVKASSKSVERNPTASGRRWAAGLLALAAATLLARSAGAESAPASYDLAACIRAALTNSPDLQAAAASLAAARAQLSEAKAGRFGEIEYTQVLGFVNEAEGDPTSSPNDKDDYLTGLGPFTRLEVEINVPIWTFGKLDAALRAAEEGLASEQAHGEIRRASVVLNTKRLYYGLLLTRQLSIVLADMLEAMDKAVAKTEKRLRDDSSSVTELDLLKLRMGRSKFAHGVIEVNASEKLTRNALARLLGLPMDTELKVADRRLRPVSTQVAPLDDYLADALPRRPEWERLQRGIAAQTAKVGVERSDYYPMLFFSTGVQFARAPNRDEQHNPFANDEFNFLRPVAVLGLRWDLNFLMTQAKVAQELAELERLRAREREAASGLLLEIRRAHASVVQARETIAVSEEGRKAGRGLLILSVSNFDLGIGEAEDLFYGLGAYTEASTDYLRAVHDYNMAVAKLSKATGRELADLDY